ncbi:MAG: aminopeptidase [Rhodospirillales bacterium 20-60-12]|nr:MAG: aminopeptidase [Rhodospirillales bacterium 20-60-12]HQT66985.1 aminopeptidase [Acetobacteraceae bacterium]
MTFETPDLMAKIDRLGAVAVEIGVNLQPGQELIVNAPVEAVPLVRAIATHAYRAGAADVLVHFNDQELSRIQLREGAEAIFDHAPGWRYDGLQRALSEGAAMLSVTGTDPNLLAGCDPARKARTQKAHAVAGRGIRSLIGAFDVNWSIVPFANPAWAAAMFPDMGVAESVARLWAAIFQATRVDGADPVANWQGHVATLHARAKRLNELRCAKLHFRGPGTDLHVGLVEGHIWHGGSAKTSKGIVCLPNMPTEEVFTMPHRARVDGVVRATKPLSHNGTLMKGIEVRFEAGRIVQAKAEAGEEAFRNLIGTDEGAAHLGEVALVPDASPISQSGLLFLNTLFDENAASHIAIGRALGINAPGGDIEKIAGANDSLIHVDWMIGSSEIDVDGILADGAVHPLMRAGAFVIDERCRV